MSVHGFRVEGIESPTEAIANLGTLARSNPRGKVPTARNTPKTTVDLILWSVNKIPVAEVALPNVPRIKEFPMKYTELKIILGKGGTILPGNREVRVLGQ